ncbi:MAG: hypothetical protein A2068_14540 [Ignavibacteria bacterium GWB2_35_6b]|nr:MAG: hypothetical protein A2068_14540 [Ignavibacteria bacterium GWB2_35_6b]
MKKLNLILGLIIFSAFFANTKAQTTKEALTQVLEFSKAKKFAEAAPLIAYDGTDETKKFKAAFNAKDENDLNSVKRICKKIKALVDISDSYEIGAQTEIEKDGIKWFVTEVGFKSGNQSLKTVFSFVKINDKFLLGDVD